MFRSLLGNRGDFKNLLLRMPIGSEDRSDFRSSESQCAGLVEDHGVHRTQEFEVQPTFDNCTFSRGPPDPPENSQRSSSCDCASAGNNDDGYGRSAGRMAKTGVEKTRSSQARSAFRERMPRPL